MAARLDSRRRGTDCLNRKSILEMESRLRTTHGEGGRVETPALVHYSDIDDSSKANELMTEERRLPGRWFTLSLLEVCLC